MGWSPGLQSQVTSSDREPDQLLAEHAFEHRDKATMRIEWFLWQ